MWKFEVLEVSPRRESDNARIVGYVSFGFETSKFEPTVRIVRDYKDGEEWKRAQVANIVCAPGSAVVVNNAFLKAADKTGELYVQVQGIELDYRFATAVAAEAAKQLEAKPAAADKAKPATEGGGAW